MVAECVRERPLVGCTIRAVVGIEEPLPNLAKSVSARGNTLAEGQGSQPLLNSEEQPFVTMDLRFRPVPGVLRRASGALSTCSIINVPSSSYIPSNGVFVSH